jgi:hypothetical protein
MAGVPHSEVMVAAIDLPLADDVERVVVEQRHPAGAFLAVTAKAGNEEAAGAAVHGVRARVAGQLAQFLGSEHLDDLRRRGVFLGVQHVQARGAQPGDDQVLAAAVVMPAARAQRA